jgi:DNA repair protein RadC
MGDGRSVVAWDETPAERLARLGEEALAEHELLALVLGGSPTDRAGLGRAFGVLQATGGLDGLARRSLEEVIRLPGLGPARARRLKAALELGRRATLPCPPRGHPLTSATDVAHWLRGRLQDRSREGLHALLLDSKNRPLRWLRLAEGTWTSCPVDPRVVFSACLRWGAPAVLLVHNHPSGDPSPSPDDVAITERMLRAGQVLGVRLVDHLIVGREGFTSLAERGLLGP